MAGAVAEGSTQVLFKCWMNKYEKMLDGNEIDCKCIMTDYDYTTAFVTMSRTSSQVM